MEVVSVDRASMDNIARSVKLENSAKTAISIVPLVVKTYSVTWIPDIVNVLQVLADLLAIVVWMDYMGKIATTIARRAAWTDIATTRMDSVNVMKVLQETNVTHAQLEDLE